MLFFCIACCARGKVQTTLEFYLLKGEPNTCRIYRYLELTNFMSLPLPTLSLDQALAQLTADHLSLSNGGLTTLLVCLSLVLTRRWHGHLTLDHHIGVQKFHSAPTPRIGGLAILLGLLVSLTYAPQELFGLLKPLLIASLPAFAFGFFEDVTKRVGIQERLLACVASGILAWWLTGYGVTRLGIWGVDTMLTFTPLVVLLTAFAVGGLANAVNMIDGFHGLAVGVVMIGLTAIGVIAYLSGDSALAKLALTVFCVCLGFFLVNFPFGKIFLGDGGSYLLGFVLGWMSILLVARNQAVSPFTAVLVCGLPILETFFSMLRRAIRGQHIGHPDRLHLHSLVKTRIARKVLRVAPKSIQNASVSPLMWLFAAVPAFVSLLTWRDNLLSALAFGASALGYWFIYRRLTKFGRARRPVLSTI
jgi:UDP-N-acetylmuramyl pentapeptide phosphotransferase/UDP-N-acetylglucosamine-1-phosphate transferase